MTFTLYLKCLTLFLCIVSCNNDSEYKNDSLAKLDHSDSTRRVGPVISRLKLCTTKSVIRPGYKSVELAHDGYLWNKDTLYVYFFDGEYQAHERVLNAANSWSNFGNICFKLAKDTTNSDIRVTFRDTGYYSYIGAEANAIPKSTHTMSLDSLDFENDRYVFDSYVLHEFGHAIGFIHEHQRPIADIPWDTVALFAHFDSIGWDKQMVRDQILNQYAEAPHGSHFDTNSIMIYWVPNYLTTTDYSIPWNYQLSPTDKKTVKRFYP